MFQNGILLTHSTPYHPKGNSQCERTNGTIWRTILLALRSQGLSESSWEMVLPSALHAIRSMLCTTTNCTPHERIFQYQRKSSSGYTLPKWLSSPGKVLVCKFVRHSKSEPLVETAELIDANPSFSRIRYPNGREVTVSTGDLANPGQPLQEADPLPSEPVVVSSQNALETDKRDDLNNGGASEELFNNANDFEGFLPSQVMQNPLQGRLESPILNEPRRSSRLRKAPDRLGL